MSITYLDGWTYFPFHLDSLHLWKFSKINVLFSFADEKAISVNADLHNCTNLHSSICCVPSMCQKPGEPEVWDTVMTRTQIIASLLSRSWYTHHAVFPKITIVSGSDPWPSQTCVLSRLWYMLEDMIVIAYQPHKARKRHPNIFHLP